MEYLFADIETCKKLQEKYSLLVSSFNWIAYHFCSVNGCNINVNQNQLHYKIARRGDYSSVGVNITELIFVKEIVRAYTMQEIVMLYKGNERLLTAQEMAEAILK